MIEQLNPNSEALSLSLEDVADTDFDMIITLCDKSHDAIPEHADGRQHLRWDLHCPGNSLKSAEELRHLEIERAERLRLILLAQHLMSWKWFPEVFRSAP